MYFYPLLLKNHHSSFSVVVKRVSVYAEEYPDDLRKEPVRRPTHTSGHGQAKFRWNPTFSGGGGGSGGTTTTTSVAQQQQRRRAAPLPLGPRLENAAMHSGGTTTRRSRISFAKRHGYLEWSLEREGKKVQDEFLYV